MQKPTDDTSKAACQFLMDVNLSRITVITHEIIAIMLPIPSVKSIKKNRAEKTCGKNVNFEMASGYASKAVIQLIVIKSY